MADPTALIAAWARSPVAPRHGALASLLPHELGAPVLQGLLSRAEVDGAQVDAVVIGNALGAGGNVARLLALASGLPSRVSALTIDTQCCAGLDAVSVGVGLIASGQARVVVAGGVESWSRSPIRMHRNLPGQGAPEPYEQAAFVPAPMPDPDMLEAATRWAAALQCARTDQEAYAIRSHAAAVAAQSSCAQEIVPVLGVDRDTYPRLLRATVAARMPMLCRSMAPDPMYALTPLTVAAEADGAGLVLLVASHAQEITQRPLRWGWHSGVSLGGVPQQPAAMAAHAAQRLLAKAGVAAAHDLAAVELHDAFAVQGLHFGAQLGLLDGQLNRGGGGLARGHPIGASGAIALVRLLSELNQIQDDVSPSTLLGLVAVAGAGGLGSAALIQSR